MLSLLLALSFTPEPSLADRLKKPLFAVDIQSSRGTADISALTVTSLYLKDSSGINTLGLVGGNHTADRTLTATAGTNLVLTLDSGTISLGSPLQLADADGSLRWTTANTSIYVRNSDQFVFRVANFVPLILVSNGSAVMDSTVKLNWSSGSPIVAGSDTGFARSAAGQVRATDGSTGLGYLLTGVQVTANTGTATPGITDSGKLYTNTGDSNGSQITLPDNPTVGARFEVAVTAAQTITVVPSSGEALYYGSDACAVSLTSNVVGTRLEIVAVTGGSGALWFAAVKGALVTDWACNDV